MKRDIPRRNFLQGVGAGAAGLLASAPGISTPGYPANETIQIACVGTGGRAQHRLMPALKEIPGVRIAAVCDVWDQFLAKGKNLAAADALATKDYREVLDRKDIHAVVIATPDHWHVPLTVEACAAGKDVYVEKPLTHKASEAALVIEAQNRHKRVIQVGMQQRSYPHMLEAYELVKSGAIGEIHKAHITWNRNSRHLGKRKTSGIAPQSVDWKMFLGGAKDQPFDEYRFRNWRWFWDFGGGILTDLMVHHIDIVNWFCDLDHPASAATIGDRFRVKDTWETPDTVQTLLHYPDKKLQVYFEGTFVNARNGSMIEFMGTDGTLYLDRGGYAVYPEPGAPTNRQEKLVGERRGQDFYGRVPGAFYHLMDWLQAVRARTKPRAPAEAGVQAASPAHLGNQAYHSGSVARWNTP